MRFRKITADDKSEFIRIIGTKKYLECEYRFSHLFIWKDSDDIKICIDDDTIFIRECNANCFMIPITDNIHKALEKLYEHCLESGEDFIVCSATQAAVNEIKSDNRYEITHLRDLDDYLYKADDLINLKGKLYHAKRNHINQFKEKYAYTYNNITENDIEDCKMMEDEWIEFHGSEPTVESERIAINNALGNMKLLDLCGGIIRVEGKVAAFTIGQITPEDMGIVHFEKADTSYIGIYTVINQLFAQNNFNNVKYINRQDDMGMDNLRQAKLSYYPERLIEKYRVTLK